MLDKGNLYGIFDNFAKYFYEYKPPRAPEDIEKNIKNLLKRSKDFYKRNCDDK